MHIEITYPAAQGASMLQKYGITVPDFLRLFLKGIGEDDPTCIEVVEKLSALQALDRESSVEPAE
jgi:hypothetical protein